MAPVCFWDLQNKARSKGVYNTHKTLLLSMQALGGHLKYSLTVKAIFMDRRVHSFTTVHTAGVFGAASQSFKIRNMLLLLAR